MSTQTINLITFTVVALNFGIMIGYELARYIYREE